MTRRVHNYKLCITLLDYYYAQYELYIKLIFYSSKHDCCILLQQNMISIECARDFLIDQAGAENVFDSWNSYTFKIGRAAIRTINNCNLSRFIRALNY